MKLNRNFLTLSALVLISLAQDPISALTSAKSSSTKSGAEQTKKSAAKGQEDNDNTDSHETVSAGQEKLTQLAQAFVAQPDDTRYAALWDSFVSFVQDQTVKQKDPSRLFKSWKVLADAGLRVLDPVGSNNAVHVYVFNRISNNYAFVPQTKFALVQWNEQLANNAERSETKKGAHRTRLSTVMKTQCISIPSSVDIKEANLLPHIVASKIVVKTTGRSRKGGKRLAKISKPVKVTSSANHFLALLGFDQQSSHTWLIALKQTSVGWVNYGDLFQDIPSFLIQSSSAKIKFSGNNLQISMGGPGGYELVMPFTDDHFAFSTKEAQDSATAVARQFLLALQYKRQDLAKVWLADPKLVSIPGYLGLFNSDRENSLRIVNMPCPICGGSRFRLITCTKDDLVLDVAKIKDQWLIKGLFIAPASLNNNIGVKTINSPNTVN